MALKNDIIKRGVPDVLKFKDGTQITTKEQWPLLRKEIISTLCNEEYGFLPPEPSNMMVDIVSEDTKFCAGKVTLTKVILKLQMDRGEFSFPVYCSIPNDAKSLPAFIHICFRDNVPDKYMPVEEICDNGFAIFSFCYNDVVVDANVGFKQGLSTLLYKDGNRNPNDCGTIAMWAWAASRVMDYVQTFDVIDKDNIAVVGHSRLGKTALLTGGLDERFAYVISNDSGCSGAAITRDKTGEHIHHITKSFPHWFCENYKKYVNKEQDLPFDQHFLLALTAPRKLYVASAEADSWADPDSEYLSCIAASPVFELLGVKGFVHPDKYPEPGDVFHNGNIAYHLRKGTHYFGRYDWQKFMEYITKNKNVL